MSFKTITGSSKGQLVKGIPPVGGGGGGGTVNSVISSDNTLTITDGAGPNVDTSVAPISSDVATLQGLETGDTAYVNRWFIITDFGSKILEGDRLYVQSLGIEGFNEHAIYYDTNTEEFRTCKYDLVNDLVVYMEDIRGNKVYHTSGVDVVNFPWGDAAWKNNTFTESTIVSIGTSSVFNSNTFISASLDLSGTTGVTFNQTTVLRGTNMIVLQDSLVCTRCTFRAEGDFTFTAATFFDLVSDCTINSAGGTVTTGTTSTTNQWLFSKIENIGDIDLSVIINTSTVYLTTDEECNNIVVALDMTDESIFLTASKLLMPVTAYATYGIGRTFVLSGENGARINEIASYGSRQRFYAAFGNSYIFEHKSIGVATTHQLVSEFGAGDITITGHQYALEFVEYEIGRMGDAQNVLIKHINLL